MTEGCAGEGTGSVGGASKDEGAETTGERRDCDGEVKGPLGADVTATPPASDGVGSAFKGTDAV